MARPRARIDVVLVSCGLAPSRERAQRLVLAGEVLVDDRPVTKPGTMVDEGAVVRLRTATSPYASRGGEKLAGALDVFGIDPTGRVGLDVGASTGGFTDVLLRRGARRVFAVDVGYGQLAWALRTDPRVVVLDRVNARALTAGQLPEVPDLVTIDVSFISMTLVLPAVAQVLAPGGEVVGLVKPQFEVGRERVGKGGVVRDDALRAESVARVTTAAEALGLTVRGSVDAAVPGPKGNREIFVWLVRSTGTASVCAGSGS